MKIDELILKTGSLEAQYQFYAHVLDLQVICKTASKVSFLVGRSVLSFESAPGSTPYHFAFNIPSNKELEALQWLKERVGILPFEGNELADFKSWNAKAIYFYDADKNIVELIARKNLGLEQTSPFDSKQILNVSEIGLPVKSIAIAFEELNAMKPIPVYDGTFDIFCAAGDEEGLFIIIDVERKKWFPTMEQAFSSEFKLLGDYRLHFSEGKLRSLQQQEI